MEKVKNSVYTICAKTTIVSFKTKKNSKFFDKLSGFEPWMWKAALVFVMSFAAGWGIAEWARYSLMK